MSAFNRMPWLRTAWRPVSILIGLMICAVCWAAVGFHLSAERDRTLNAAITEATRLSQLLEANTAGLIKGIDRTLLLMRLAYEENPENFNFHLWADRAIAAGDVTTEVGLIDAKGLLQRRTDYKGPPIDLSDREQDRKSTRLNSSHT